MVKTMSKVREVANKLGNESKVWVKEAINRFLEKDVIRRKFEALLPQKSLIAPLAPVKIKRDERIGITSVTRFRYGGKP